MNETKLLTKKGNMHGIQYNSKRISESSKIRTIHAKPWDQVNKLHKAHILKMTPHST